MKYFLLLLSALVTMAVKINLPQKFCDIQSETMNPQCFIKEILLTIGHSSNQLVVHKPTNMLYFSFDARHGDYTPAVYNFTSRNLTVLKGVKDAFAIADDPYSDDMYFGGSNGIYKYNPPMKLLKRLAFKKLDVWWLFIKKKIFFVKFPSLKAYYYYNKDIRPVPQLKSVIVHQFVFDSDDNVIYINTTGLYGVKKGLNQSVLLKGNLKFISLAMDSKGHLYACSDDAIYIVNTVVLKVKKFISVQGILGFTFDRYDNIIYSDSHDLVRLSPVS